MRSHISHNRKWGAWEREVDLWENGGGRTKVTVSKPEWLSDALRDTTLALPAKTNN